MVNKPKESFARGLPGCTSASGRTWAGTPQCFRGLILHASGILLQGNVGEAQDWTPETWKCLPGAAREHRQFWAPLGCPHSLTVKVTGICPKKKWHKFLPLLLSQPQFWCSKRNGHLFAWALCCHKKIYRGKKATSVSSLGIFNSLLALGSPVLRTVHNSSLVFY